jgi:hypothetical protein
MLLSENSAAMNILRSIGKIAGGTLLVLGGFVVGALGAFQLGWSAADLVVNAPFNGVLGNFISGLLFGAGVLVAYGAIFVVEKFAKPLLWVLIPVFVYCAAVPGAWNGVATDFDRTRGEVMKRHYANGYAIDHMTDRGRYLSCQDESLQFTADAKAACAKALHVSPGERIPGSEHRCGFLKMLSCFDNAPAK